MEDKYSLSVARALEHCEVCKKKQANDYDWCVPLCHKCEPGDCGWQICEECYVAGKIAIEKDVKDPVLQTTWKSDWECPSHHNVQ